MQKCPYLTSCQKASHTLSQADFLKQFPLGIFEGSLETPLGTFDFKTSYFRQFIFFQLQLFPKSLFLFLLLSSSGGHRMAQV